MSDVRNVFDLGFAAFKAALILLIASLLALRRIVGRGGFFINLATAAAAGLGALLLLLAAMSINFSRVFTWFHLAFFSGDSWLFAPDSVLIRLFPFTFWARAGLHWVLLTMLELGVLAAGAALLGRSEVFGQLDPEASGNPGGESHVVA